jgi:hypothetical protein
MEFQGFGRDRFSNQYQGSGRTVVADSAFASVRKKIAKKAVNIARFVFLTDPSSDNREPLIENSVDCYRKSSFQKVISIEISIQFEKKYLRKRASNKRRARTCSSLWSPESARAEKTRYQCSKFVNAADRFEDKRFY